MTDTHVPADRRPELFDDGPGVSSGSAVQRNPWRILLLVIWVTLIALGLILEVASSLKPLRDGWYGMTNEMPERGLFRAAGNTILVWGGAVAVAHIAVLAVLWKPRSTAPSEPAKTSA